MQGNSSANALNIATTLRQQIQALAVQVEAQTQKGYGGQELSQLQGLIALTNATSLAQNLALELAHRLAVAGHQSTVCSPDCHLHCPWFRASQRIDRWAEWQDLGPEGYRPALHDFQFSIVVAASLADYLEGRLHQLSNREDKSGPLGAAFCISSWMRKLAQLLNMAGLKLCAEHEFQIKTSPDNS